MSSEISGILVDSCVLLDLFTNDKCWADWSEDILEKYSATNTLYINSMIYTEVAIGFHTIEAVESTLKAIPVKVLEMPREALFLAGKAFLDYRKNKGTKSAPLPDFFIGAHGSVTNLHLITRDTGKYRTYFPGLQLIHPDSH